MSRKRLGELLQADLRFPATALTQALDAQTLSKPRKRIGQVLVERGLASESDVVRALSLQLGIPMVDPLVESVDPVLLHKVPLKFAESQRALVLTKLDKGVRVAMADPLNTDAVRDLEFRLGAKVLIEVAGETKIRQALVRHYELEPQAQRLLAEIPVEMRPPVTSPTALELDQPVIQRGLEKGGSAYVDLLNQLLANAIQRGASDIHIEPQQDGVRVRFRIDGLLRDVLAVPQWACQGLTNRVKVVGNMNVAENRRPQDGRALARIGPKQVDLRLSVVPSHFGEQVVIRILDASTITADFKALGFSARSLGVWYHLIAQPSGMLLITGPTGSGKSTTLYATLNRLKSPTTSIVTVEDPVEHTIPGVSQVSVNESAGRSFASVVRSVLRQDPNVLIIGEIRDTESAAAAADAASTGHLVISTLHTPNATAAITRLRDLEVPDYLLAPNLLGVIGQRLVRKLCGVCSVPTDTTDEEWERLGMDSVELGPGVRRAGPGCPTCRYQGYQGRVAVFELLELTEAFRQKLAEADNEMELAQYARDLGFVPMIDDALGKVRDGITTMEEVARAVPVDSSRLKGRKAPEVVARPGIAMPMAPITIGPTSRERPLLLLVDDAEEILQLLVATLEDDYDLVLARDGAEALEKLGEAQPDAVVLDVMMPKLSGYEVCAKIKMTEATQDMPVLMLSARGEKAHIKEGLTVGADDYLPKPFDPEELALRMRSLLRRAGKLGRS